MADEFRFQRDRVYDGLIDFILSGAVDPDAPLSERKLGDSLVQRATASC